MSRAPSPSFVRAAIEFHARECERQLRLAVFAESEPLYGLGGPSIARGLRLLAADSSAQAFALSRSLFERSP